MPRPLVSSLRTLNLLIEKLCAIELRDLRNCQSQASGAALVANRSRNSRTSQNPGTSAIKKKDRTDPKSRFPCRVCKNLGHWAAECPQKPAEKREGASFVANALEASVGELSPLSWYCDSGASRHISPDRECFETFTKFDTPERISLGKKGAEMFACGEGDVRMTTYLNGGRGTLVLRKVLFVPEAAVNLLSVRVAAEAGFQAVLGRTGVVVLDERSGRAVVIGYPRGGQFVMDVSVVKPKCAVEVNLSATTKSLQLYHERLGHQDKQHVKAVLQRQGIPSVEDGERFCDGCAQGKMHRLPYRSRVERAAGVGELIHTDVNGPMQTKSIGGNRYFVCFKDDYSRFRRIFFLKEKSQVCDALEQFLNEAEANGHRIQKLRSDGGGEFVGKRVAKLLADRGIAAYVAPPYSPEINGVAERENRTLVEAARSMLCASRLPRTLWAEACSTAAYILNRTGKSSVEGVTPNELWFGGQAGLMKHLKVFGTGCYVYVQKKFREKFDSKSVFGHLVGYVNDRDGYRIFCPSSKRVLLSHDVRFKPEKLCTSEDLIEPPRTQREVVELAVRQPTRPSSHPHLEQDERQLHWVEQSSRSEESDNEISRLEGEEDPVENYGDAAAGSSDSESGGSEGTIQQSEGARTSGRVTKKPEHLRDFVCLADEPSKVLPANPQSYTEAIRSSEKEQWLQAMKNELQALNENETWDLVDRPSGVRVIRNRWVLRIKDLENGEKKFKARLVAQGFVQRQGIDYDETFSPVARYDTVRALLAIAASRGSLLAQFDVRSAFLYGKIENREVFLEQPDGFADGSGKVCRLKRSLYGLKESPRCWSKRFSTFMHGQGFVNSEADTC